MATPANTPRRSWLRPRFSLRVLLLAVTAFAIGFPIWWRWPYEEVEPVAYGSSYAAKEITTWQRQWGGGRIQHGPHILLVDGQIKAMYTYRHGQLHGPCMPVSFDESVVTGQFVDGEKDGVWTETVNGQKQKTTYDHGKQVSP